MTTPVVLSPSGRWLATTSPESNNRVSIRDSNTGRLQCTIRCPNQKQAKMVWLTDSIVATAVPTVSFLNVTRGVAVTSSKNNKLQQHTAVVDVAVADDLLYVLEAKSHDDSNNKKWIVYEYNEEQQLLRKIKVGKIVTGVSSEATSIRLFATPEHLLVGSNTTQSWRVVNRSTGSKVCKLMGTVQDVVGQVAVGSTTGGAVMVWSLRTGNVIGTIPGMTNTEDLHVCEDTTNKCYHVLAGSQQLFRFQILTSDDDEEQLTSTLVCTLPEPKSRKETVHFVLHYEELLRAVRFSDAMECTALVVDTTADPVVLQWTAKEQNKITNASLKRKQESAVLGPGQAGHESKTLTEASASTSKRSCFGSEGSVSDEEEDDGPTIAERLAHLQKSLEAEEDRGSSMSEGEEEDEDAKMTTESLYQLLHQALQSADKQQLEKALEVRDADTVAQSCRELGSESVAALLVALTHRLATKPTRADHLSIWLTAILRHNPHVAVEHLLPLQNLLQERLEIFPMLLELEGRLDQLAGS